MVAIIIALNFGAVMGLSTVWLLGYLTTEQWVRMSAGWLVGALAACVLLLAGYGALHFFSERRRR